MTLLRWRSELRGSSRPPQWFPAESVEGRRRQGAWWVSAFGRRRAVGPSEANGAGCGHAAPGDQATAQAGAGSADRPRAGRGRTCVCILRVEVGQAGPETGAHWRLTPPPSIARPGVRADRRRKQNYGCRPILGTTGKIISSTSFAGPRVAGRVPPAPPR